MSRTSPIKIFESMDNRHSSNEILFVREGERAILVSQGWDCDNDCEEICVYRFMHYPSDAQCEDAIIYKYERDDGSCCGETEEVSLTGGRTQIFIEEAGAYLLHRACGAEMVAVIGKYEKKPH